MINLDTIILEAINSLGDGYYWIMKSLSEIGKGTTYFLIIIVLIWCVDYKKYSKLALIIPFSGLMAETLKVVFHMLRPWHISEGISAIESYGMPSGHALSAAAFWSYIAYTARKRIMWAIGIIMIIGIGISRIYRGSHFPSQVLVGYAIGAFLIIGFIKFNKSYKEKFFDLKKSVQILTIVALPLTFILSSVIAYFVYSDGNGLENISSAFQLAGLFIGFAVGLLYIRDKGEFDVKVVWWKQLIKLAVCGISFLLYPLILKYSCKLTDIVWIECFISIVISFFAGMWFVYYAPLIFQKYNLVKKIRK